MLCAFCDKSVKLCTVFLHTMKVIFRRRDIFNFTTGDHN